MAEAPEKHTNQEQQESAPLDYTTAWFHSHPTADNLLFEESNLRTHSKGTDTKEYQKLLRRSATVIDQLASAKLAETLANELRSKNLITTPIHAQATNAGPDVVDTTRITPMINSVLAKVEMNTEWYYTFIAILRGINGTDDIVQLIEAPLEQPHAHGPSAAVTYAKRICESISRKEPAVSIVKQLYESDSELFAVSEVNKPVLSKSRYLEIRVVNLSHTQTLEYRDQWFKSGRVWTDPYPTTPPGHIAVFYVCNRDWAVTTGVSGGVAFMIREKDGSCLSEDGKEWFVCTFSYPKIKECQANCQFKDKGIKPVWDNMWDAMPVYNKRCGLFKHQPHVTTFMWKDPDTLW